MGRPWVAWAGIVGGSLAVVASELVGLVWGLGAGVGWGWHRYDSGLVGGLVKGSM